MTFLGSTAILIGCAAAVFLVGLLAVHFSQARSVRISLWQTFCQAVLLGDRYGVQKRTPASTLRTPDPTSQFQSLAPPL